MEGRGWEPGGSSLVAAGAALGAGGTVLGAGDTVLGAGGTALGAGGTALGIGCTALCAGGATLGDESRWPVKRLSRDAARRQAPRSGPCPCALSPSLLGS
ncbi:MAG TPA: hypothetical protein VIW29_02200, partial [Polyangiaceae bacterium]